MHIALRWAEGHYDRLPPMIEDLVKQRVSAIVTFGPPAAIAAKRASTLIPIVFTVGLDPVAAGLVPSLNRPGWQHNRCEFFQRLASRQASWAVA